MSHFTAVVILKDPDDLADALAPYDEGQRVSPYPSDLGAVSESAASARSFYRQHPEHGPQVEGRQPTEVDLASMTDEALALHYHQDEGENVRVEGARIMYDSTYNPASKWDWYSVGGRWRGFFGVRPGATAQLGETSWVHRGDQTDYSGRADIVQVKDVDWDGMQERARVEAEQAYDQYEAAVGDAPEPTPWDVVRREAAADAGISDDWDTYRAQHGDDGEDWRVAWDKAMGEARQRYRSQPWCERLRKAGIWAAGPEDYFVGAGGREAFVAARVARVGIPLAVVHDGQWLERGSMGWFGVIRDEQDRDVWNAKVRELFDSLDPELWLVAVDCHI